jgi:serine/threonine protein kinase
MSTTLNTPTQHNPTTPLQTQPTSQTSITLNDKPSSSPSSQLPIAILANKYNLTKKIGKGGTSCVYLGHSISEPSIDYAFKIIKSPSSQILQNEYTILSSLSHNNIIKAYSFQENISLHKPNKNKTKTVSYLQLEYIEYGELFDFVYYPKKGFGENFTRLLTYKLALALNN